MESRFSKYESSNNGNNNGGSTLFDHINAVNKFVDQLYNNGLDLIEKELQELQKKIDDGSAPAMFYKKKPLLIQLGKCIERVYEAYHFNKDKEEAA